MSSAALSRLQSISWNKLATTVSERHVALGREFLTRASRLKRAHQLQGCNPIAILTELPGMEQHAPERHTLESAIPEGLPPLVRMIAAIYLGVSDPAASDSPLVPQVLSAIELLLIVLEEGGMVDIHRGYLVIDDRWSIPLSQGDG